MNWLEYIIDWSEVWILLLPIIAIYRNPGQPVYLKPVLVYLIIALLCNLTCDLMVLFAKSLPPSLRTNTIIYNIHSLTRFICFTWFFFTLPFKHYKYLQMLLTAIFLLIFIVYFTWYDSFFNKSYISSDMMTGESFFLLCFCMLYYLSLLKEEDSLFAQQKHFWVVTGLGIFAVINFFIFLFYKPLLSENVGLALQIWNLHNFAFILFIIFITKAFYVPVANKY
jgi:hypothetical protein